MLTRGVRTVLSHIWQRVDNYGYHVSHVSISLISGASGLDGKGFLSLSYQVSLIKYFRRAKEMQIVVTSDILNE